MSRITLGLEVCCETPPDVLHDARFGLLANQASLDSKLRYAHERLVERFPGKLAALFAPQHGFFGEQQDNMVETPHARLGPWPVHSLYAESRRPSRSMLRDLDCLVVDLQDVGARVYTFAWTLRLCMEACAESGVSVLVLDRPNPLGGLAVEGPRLPEDHFSFVGLASVPMRHGLTLAELARWMNREVGADLHVVPMGGWLRDQGFARTDLRWVPPSPNLPRLEGVLVYPGQVLLEGTNLSEGRGTTTPFEVCGAPFVDPFALRDALGEQRLPGVFFRPIRFEPTFHKWSGRSCGGLFLHVTDPVAFRPYLTTAVLLATIQGLWPGRLQWRPPPYEYEYRRLPIDVLSGDARLRAAIERGAERDELEELCAVDERAWWSEVADALLYGPRPAG